MAIEILDIPIQSASVQPVIVQGDTIPKITVTSADFPDLTTSTIKMQIYNSDVKVLDVSSVSGITVLSATSFEIDELPAASNTLPIGISLGDLQITDTNGLVKTYFQVRYTVIKQYTV